MSKPTVLAALREFLDAQGPGRVEDIDTLVDHVEPVWSRLVGAEDGGMVPWKVRRMEDPQWSPPRLTFVVERHGGMPFGSTRAALQRWTVDLDSGTASFDERGHRQLLPQAPRLDVKPIADEITHLIVDGVEDDRLKWSADHDSVRILVGRFIPTVGYQQTIAGRRKRLQKALEPRLETDGWVTGSARWTYVRGHRTGA